MSQSFTLLWEKILRSSLWVVESKETRLVWITILAMKNSEGQVFSSVIGLADAAKVTLEECRQALAVLLAPDPNDTSKVEEGRRIREIPGGWQVVNHDMYRFSTDEKRAYWAAQKAKQRQKKKQKIEPPVSATFMAREERYSEALERGDEAAADAIAAEGLPELSDSNPPLTPRESELSEPQVEQNTNFPELE